MKWERSGALAHYGVLGMKWGIQRTPEQLGRRETTSKDTSSNDSGSKWEDDENQFLKKMLYRINNEATGIDHADSIRSDEINKYVKATKDRYTPEQRAEFAKESIKIFDELEEAEYRLRIAKGTKERRVAEEKYDKAYLRFDGDGINPSEATHLEMRFDQDDYWEGHKLLRKENWDTWSNRLRKEAAPEKKKNWFGHTGIQVESSSDWRKRSFAEKGVVEGTIQDYMEDTKFQNGQDFASGFLEHVGSEELDILKTEPVSDEDLAHYGVLGMKWGIIRTPAQLGRVGGIGGRFPFSTRKKLAEQTASPGARTKRLSELTDEELNTVITRLQKEKLYKDLINPPGGKGKSNPVVQKGESIAHKMLSSFGVMLASKFAAGAGEYLADKFSTPRKVKLQADNANEAARLKRRNSALEEKRQEDADWARLKRNEREDRALAKIEEAERRRQARKLFNDIAMR